MFFYPVANTVSCVLKTFFIDILHNLPAYAGKISTQGSWFKMDFLLVVNCLKLILCWPAKKNKKTARTSSWPAKNQQKPARGQQESAH